MQKTTAKDFFIHIAVMVTLYASAVSLLTLLFQIINYAFPDRVDFYYDPYSGAMRMAIATLIIIFPIFLSLAYFLRKDYAQFPDKHESALRKWLVYFTLFITAAAIATDLVVLINTYLGGEITARFAWKILSVLVVAGMIFGYYLYDLKRSATEFKHAKIFSIAASILVIASIVWGFVTVGSPAEQRKLRFDNQKVQHLEQIQHQIVYSYYPQKSSLPASLATVEETMLGAQLPRDPQTDAPYEYEKISETKFKLCAEFNLSGQVRGESIPKPMTDYNLRGGGWAHEAGRECFERTVDPDIVIPKPRF